jgi:hypothetical protein
MDCVKSLTTIKFLAGERRETSMANARKTTVSRRSTRLFEDDQMNVEAGAAGMAYESRYGSSSDEKDKEKPTRDRGSTSSNFDVRLLPVVDLGIDLFGMFPTTAEDMAKQGMWSSTRSSRT